MKRITLSAITLFVAFAGFASPAAAQVRTTPPGKLFFEGDIVKHNLEGQIGPFCVLQSRFMRGEAVAWRMRLALPNGQNADDKVVKSLVVEMKNGEKVTLDYGPHGNPPTDFFWANSWTIPANHPTGSLGYKVVATMVDGTVVTWEPFTRPASQLWVVEGTPVVKTATSAAQ
jgi:hypothetical protein